jgi:hypothetical protein
MHKNFSTSKSNYYTAYREGFHANSASWVIYGVQVFCGLFIGAGFYWLKLDYFLPNWIIALMLPVFMFFTIMFIHKLSVNAIFKESPERFGAKTFEIGSSGIFELDQKKPVTWDKLDTFRKSKNYLFLFGPGEDAYFIFPKSIFSELEISQIEKWFGGQDC